MIVINDNFRERQQLHLQSIIQGKNLFVCLIFLKTFLFLQQVSVFVILIILLLDI